MHHPDDSQYQELLELNQKLAEGNEHLKHKVQKLVSRCCALERQNLALRCTVVHQGNFGNQPAIFSSPANSQGNGKAESKDHCRYQEKPPLSPIYEFYESENE